MNNKLKNILQKNNIEFTRDRKSTYYIMSDGTQINLGYMNGYGRYNSHRDLFGILKKNGEDIEMNDFKTLLNRYNLIGYCPENNQVWNVNDNYISERQQEFIDKYNCEVYIENFNEYDF